MDKQAAGSTLISHVDTTLVTRDQLAALPKVVPTATFMPVAHIELVDTLTKALAKRDINIRREQYAIRRDGSCLFGTLDLSLNGIEGSCASLGLRTSNDKSMSIQLIAGLRIFVCDNLAFNGDMVALKRKHTSGLNLIYEMENAVRRYERHYFNLKSEVEVLRNKSLTDDAAKAMILDAIYKYEALPQRFGKAVMDEYFQPQHDEFQPRTAWSLHNAFTEVIKQIKAKKEGQSALHLQMDASQAVGKVFGLYGQIA